MVASILIAALLTFLLRYIPVKLSSRISPDGTMAQVAAHMPLGIMVILVVYTFLGGGVEPTSHTSGHWRCGGVVIRDPVRQHPAVVCGRHGCVLGNGVLDLA
ncbi:AzlD domain-containing protein [Corynebacterium auriscanis]|uniref:AzlD domain-containing protein n=1 Tax=Corynebacterium auriscanis TaxID=99807 RepID=UPI00396A45F8|nr:AzlD domain-containing protein [Corynebacterium auriscanis]